MPSSRTISANGIDIFLLEQGEGPLVLLCHGWPELSYSWRHQIPALAAAGFHVAVPDMRGFGRTAAPADVKAYSIFDTVGDMVALVEALGEKQAIIVGHDWGAPVAWHAALFRPDLFKAVAGLSVPPGRTIHLPLTLWADRRTLLIRRVESGTITDRAVRQQVVTCRPEADVPLESAELAFEPVGPSETA